MNKYLVFSHGFGVKQDSKGMFTSIANAFTEYTSVMFDYYIEEIEEQNNIFTIPSLHDQAKILQNQIDMVRQHDNNAEITVIGHSQGCVVTSLADLQNITQTILLAPPGKVARSAKAKEYFRNKPGVEVQVDGSILLPRKDGSTSRITQAFIDDLTAIDPITNYQSLSKLTSLSIVIAKDDEMLRPVDFSPLAKTTHLIEIDSDHNFTGEYRSGLLSILKSLLS